MRKSAWPWIVVLAACKRDDAPPPEPPPRAFGVVAEIRGEATLVAGTGRFAVRAGTGWYESPSMAARPELGPAVAKEVETLGGVVDVFLGTTPIVVGGEEHRELHIRVAPARTPIALDGLATKIETRRDGVEVWAYTHELTQHLAFVRGAVAEPAPPFERLAPVPDAASPVSRKRCEVPRVQDVAVSDRFAFALVVECNETAPVRVVRYDGTQPTVTTLPRTGTADKLVVSPRGDAVVVGTHDGKLAIDRAGGASTTYGAVKRVFAAALAGDGAVWVFALDADDKPAILRDGQVVPLDGRTATALATDATLGVSVLARGPNAFWVLAEHPPAAPVVITSPP